jgi:threonine dehydrogenase-like Zn-dependent dehydrogenase
MRFGIVVIGAGVVGLLVAALATRLPGAEVTVIDAESSRASIAQLIGARFATANDFSARCRDDADVVFHASASSAGLSLALACAGFEAKVVELSWYGEGPVEAHLGQGFHSNRLQLVSSQVGHVSPSRRPRWPLKRRLAKALELLFITEEVAFSDLPRQLPRLLAAGAPGLATVVRYSPERQDPSCDDADATNLGEATNLGGANVRRRSP